MTGVQTCALPICFPVTIASLPVVPRSARKRLTNLDDRSRGIQKYDVDNKYPQAVMYAIASSGTASACQDEVRKFLRGNGLAI